MAQRERRTYDHRVKSQVIAARNLDLFPELEELGYASRPVMTMTAEQVLVQLRALTPADRLYVVERIVHEVAAEVTPAAPVVNAASICGYESDAEFEAFQSAVQRLRSNDVWRSGDAEGAH